MGSTLPTRSNEAVLVAQADVIYNWTRSDPAFSGVVELLRRSATNITIYSLPPGKHVSALGQCLPMGSSRVVAGAADVDEHVMRATAVSSMPRRDPWSMVLMWGTTWYVTIDYVQ